MRKTQIEEIQSILLQITLLLKWQEGTQFACLSFATQEEASKAYQRRKMEHEETNEYVVWLNIIFTVKTEAGLSLKAKEAST